MIKRIKNKHILWFIAIVLLVLGTAAVTYPQSSMITLHCKIVNGTNGGEVAESLPVLLLVYSEETEVETYETASEVGGGFLFSDIDLTPGDYLITETTYEGVTYYSDEIIYESEAAIPELQIEIYNTTNSSEAIEIKYYHLMINKVEDQLRIGEYYLVSNHGDHTWIGGKDPETVTISTLEFILPDDAQGLWFSGEGLGVRYFETEDGFIDTKPIPPGEESVEVFFSYEIPFYDPLQFERKMSFPIDEAEILVSETSGILISGESIVFDEKIETEMGTALSYSAGELAADEALSIIISERPINSDQSNGLNMLFGILFFAAALFGAYWFWWRPGPKALPDEISPLVQKIIDLDQDYEKGHISKQVHQQQRKAVKEEIRDVIDRVKKDQ